MEQQPSIETATPGPEAALFMLERLREIVQCAKKRSVRNPKNGVAVAEMERIAREAIVYITGTLP
jgi:hypothetical protein